MGPMLLRSPTAAKHGSSIGASHRSTSFFRDFEAIFWPISRSTFSRRDALYLPGPRCGYQNQSFKQRSELVMTFITYAQNLEDVMLWRALKHVEHGFYIDVGANDPVEFSVTKAFYDRGWRGINVEPIEEWMEKLRQYRPEDINIQAAAADRSGEIELFAFPNTGLSTTRQKETRQYAGAGLGEPQRVTVRSVTLDDICRDHDVEEIHFLKIDVEGAEKDVLNGFSFRTHRPWILVVEATAPFSNTDISEHWEKYVLDKGYDFVYFDGLNKFYVAIEHRDLASAFAYPPNIIDDYVPALRIALEGRLQDAASQIEDRDRIIQVSDQRVAELNAWAEQLRGQLSQKDVAIQVSEQRVAELNAWAEHVEAELARTYQSRSWKVTEPLRKADNAYHIAISRVARAVKSLVVSVVFFTYRIAMRSNFLKRSAISILNKFPYIKDRMWPAIYARITKGVQAGSQEVVHVYSTPQTGRVDDSDLPEKEYYKLRDDERVVLFYVEHTATFDRITGVQRVCHKLASMLENCCETLILVKLDHATLNLTPLSDGERQDFISRSGVMLKGQNDALHDPEIFQRLLASLRNQARHSWLIIPEVTYHTTHPTPPTSRLVKLSRDFGLKVGVIFYDIIPFLTKAAAENALKHASYLSTIATADVIWPISHYSSDLLIDYYRRHEKLTGAEMPVISVNTLAEEMDTPRHIEWGAGAGGNIVCIGTIDERKNQISLVKAFNKYCREFSKTEWKLYIIGLVRDGYRPIIEKAASGNPNIEFYYNATEEDVEQFYKNCNFTVFPSLEEGYGLPIVESLWNIRPCICANFGSMDELRRNGGCIAIDTRNVNAIYYALIDLIEDKKIYQQKIDEIMQRPMKTWFEYANYIVEDMNKMQFGVRYEGFIYYWIDATVATKGNTGIQRVSRQLAKQLIAQGHKLVPIKWDDRKERVTLATDSDLAHMARWNGPAEGGWYSSVDLDPKSAEATYLMVDLPLNRPLDVQTRVIDFFKERAVRCVALFYDAIPVKLEAIYPPYFTAAHKEYMEILDRMDLIIPISGTSARDLVDFLNKSRCRGLALEERIKTVELPSDFPEIRQTLGPVRSAEDDWCHILIVGTVEPRKNHETLIRAFFKAEKKSPRKLNLTIVGGGESFDTELPQKIENLIGGAQNIEWIKSASDDILRMQYNNADFTVFASFEEGFGLPIVESLWFGVPCICAGYGQMAELARHGGCVTVDVLNVEELGDAIAELANNPETMKRLQGEIQRRYFKTWEDYASEVSSSIRSIVQIPNLPVQPATAKASYQLPPTPILSVCVTTYNRADWLDINLENLRQISAPLRDKIEIVVCDNCSTDATPQVVKRFLGEKNFACYINSANIGMLGNLSQTISHAKGDYVWLIGDDDLIHAGALEKILDIIETEAPDLINVNYAYSPDPTPPNVANIEQYLSTATTICDGGGSVSAAVKKISAFNENFYTAIYTFVGKRKHAQRIFTQDTSGAPFSSLQTCVPSSKYVLSHLMELAGYWVNDPVITINMNVSWGKYTPLWILERVPEVYDLAELNGVPQEQADRWRRHTLQMMTLHFFGILFGPEGETFGGSFDVVRFVRRSKHLQEFRELFPQLEAIYEDALSRKHPLATVSLNTLKTAIE
jgi:FkbM family methyltransferase